MNRMYSEQPPRWSAQKRVETNVKLRKSSSSWVEVAITTTQSMCGLLRVVGCGKERLALGSGILVDFFDFWSLAFVMPLIFAQVLLLLFSVFAY